MKKLVFFLLFIPLISFSQKQVQGIILDAETKNPLPFASVITNTNSGTLSDVEGKFSIKTNTNFSQITISYVGYTSVEIPINKNNKFITVKLKPAVQNLNEVLITATENPALQIIRNTIANKSKNNIEKSLNSFKFNTYNKILITANPDSISGKIDSVFFINNGEKHFKELDSTNYNFKKDIVKQHLYIAEKISEFQFEKGKKKKEIILASRMAGLKKPIYKLFAVTFQDFSFYNENYTIAGTRYINPIAKNALKKYNYKILDTVKNGHGNSYIIYFKPTERKAFLGIEGVLYIDTKSFAITKAISELKGIVNIKSTQNYTYLEAYKIWFPSNKNIKLKKGDTDDNVALFGTLTSSNNKIDKKKDSIIKNENNKPEDIVYFISKSVNSNIEINTPIKIKKSSATIRFNDDATQKNDDFWNTYRSDSLTNRGKTTYVYLDSVAKSKNLDKKINFAQNILKGFFPTKYINLNIGKILNLNEYEGFRFGFGGITNSNFSQKFKIEAYGAYGLKDQVFKYSFGSGVRLAKESNTWVGLRYTNDIKEAASLNFLSENTSFTPINPRNLNISKFYNYKIISALLYYDIQPNIEAKIEFNTGSYEALFDYQYVSPTTNVTKFNLTNAVIGVYYSPKNEYINTPSGKIKIRNGYPQFTIQLTQSLKDISDSDFGFTQFNMRILHEIIRLRKSITSFFIEAGIDFGETPISHLYNSTPNYTYKNPWIKRVAFAGQNSFETMGYNEFISDRFVALHIKHQFRFFNFGGRFKPQLKLVTKFAIGDINNPEYHQNMTFKSMSKGYYESGIELNSIIKGIGFSTFYRYGPYKNSEWSDNLAVKITYNFTLGF